MNLKSQAASGLATEGHTKHFNRKNRRFFSGLQTKKSADPKSLTIKADGSMPGKRATL